MTLIVFLVSLFIGISSGNAPWNAEGWSSRFTIVCFLISLVNLLFFLQIELTIVNPIIDLRIFKNRNFLMGNIVLFVFSFTLFGSSFLLPLYMQNGLGFSQLQTGIVLLPLGLAQGFFGGVSGWLSRKVSPMLLVLGSLILLALTYYVNARFTLYTSEATMVHLFIVRGIAMGMLFAPLVALTSRPFQNLSFLKRQDFSRSNVKLGLRSVLRCLRRRSTSGRSIKLQPLVL